MLFIWIECQRVCIVSLNVLGAIFSGLKSWGHSLKSLKLTGCNLVDQETWHRIWACTTLSCVSIQGSVAVFGPTKPVVGLKHLELSSCSLARFKGRSASMFSSLESLVLKACTFMPVDLLDQVKSKELKLLDVSRVEINVKLDPTLLPRLESLDISGTLSTSLDGVPGGLHRLILSRCPIGEQELARIPVLCPSLQELRLPNKIDPAMDSIVTKSFSSLPICRLDLEGASKLTDAGMSGLSCLRDSLTFLSLVGTGITDASLSVINEFHFLQELYLDRTGITTLDLPGMI
jgi:Leucine-rich repeat (LRR) protein